MKVRMTLLETNQGPSSPGLEFGTLRKAFFAALPLGEDTSVRRDQFGPWTPTRTDRPGRS